MTATEHSAAVRLSRKPSQRNHPSLWRLFLLHLKVGNTVFGGGDPTSAALQSEIVATRKWISREKYGVVFALARITPGTNLLAFCAGLSWELMGWTGALVALLAMTAPAAVIVLLLTHEYGLLRSNGPAMAAIEALMAAAVGMMAAAAFQLARPYFQRKRRWYSGAIVATAIILSLRFSVSPIQILGLAGVAGYLWQVPE